MATQPTDDIVRVAENDTTLPSTGLANKLEPTTQILTVGYDLNELVPAEDLNYIFDNFGKWLEYCKQVAEGQITAGNGLESDANDIGTGQTLSVGTPSSVGAGSSNSTSPTSHSHALNISTDNVSILTGTIAHGGTIPLPSGYSESQCKWMISFNDMNPSSIAWDIPETDAYVHLKTSCFTTGRVVTAQTTVRGTNPVVLDSTANYIIIGVK